MPLGPKMALPGGGGGGGVTYFTLAYIGKNTEKYSLSETIRLRALILGHILASTSGTLLCSNYATRAKITPHSGRQGHGQLSIDTYM